MPDPVLVLPEQGADTPLQRTEDCAEPAVSIHLLGALQVFANGIDVTGQIKYRKGLALLAMLAVECDVVHSRDRLADFFWPSLPLTAARSNLRQVLSNLSRVLGRVGPSGSPALHITHNTVGLPLGKFVDLDVHRVEAASRARLEKNSLAQVTDLVGRFRIPAPSLLNQKFLSGFDLPDCPDYSVWLSQQRRYFEDCVIAIYEFLGERAEATGELELALHYARHAADVDPLLEINQSRLIRLLALSGRPKRAVLQYREFAERLREELDVEPEPATRALYLQISNGDFSPALNLRTPVPACVTDSNAPAPERTRLQRVTIIYAACSPLPRDAYERRVAARRLRESTEQILREHGCELVETVASGVLAFMAWSEPGVSGGTAAIAGARIVMQRVCQADQLRIGMFTDVVVLGDPAHYTEEFREAAELAYRLSLIAEDGEIVACGQTLAAVAVPTTPIGVWNLRGIPEPLELYRVSA